MTDNMKQFLTELAELLEKHKAEINAVDYSLEFSRRGLNDTRWEVYRHDDEASHETLKELLK
jgi:hypothetical protein